MAKVLEVIWGKWEQKYFCKGDSTPPSANGPTGKSLDCADQQGSDEANNNLPHAVQHCASLHQVHGAVATGEPVISRREQRARAIKSSDIPPGLRQARCG